MAHMCVGGGVYAQIFKCEVFFGSKNPRFEGR